MARWYRSRLILAAALALVTGLALVRAPTGGTDDPRIAWSMVRAIA